MAHLLRFPSDCSHIRRPEALQPEHKQRECDWASTFGLQGSHWLSSLVSIISQTIAFEADARQTHGSNGRAPEACAETDSGNPFFPDNDLLWQTIYRVFGASLTALTDKAVVVHVRSSHQKILPGLYVI